MFYIQHIYIIYNISIHIHLLSLFHFLSFYVKMNGVVSLISFLGSSLIRYKNSAEGSVVKNTCCFCRGSRFSSRNLHSSTQPSTTPRPGDPMFFSDLHWHQAHIRLKYIPAGKRIMHTKANLNLKSLSHIHMLNLYPDTIPDFVRVLTAF